MERLRATRPVLYQGRMYEPGEALPATDARMVEAWLEAGSAEMAPLPTEDPQTPPAPPAGAQDGQDGDQGTQDQPAPPAGAQDGQKMVTGHLDPKQLEKMKKDDLVKLAEDMGVDVSGAKNNAERAALIAAVPVQAPASDNGGAQ